MNNQCNLSVIPTMKKASYLLTLFVTLVLRPLPVAHGQGFPVIDISAIAQALEQARIATDQLNLAKLELERLGDPKAIQTDAANALMRSLSIQGVGQTLQEIQETATAISGAQFVANGLFKLPTETIVSASGESIARQIHEYRKYDAIAQAVGGYQAVLADTRDRRQALRQQIQDALRQLQKAATMAEVEKIQGVLTALNAELATVDREREAAEGTVLVQKALNEADTARQQQSRREETEVSIREATEKVGQAIKVDTSIIRIPIPRFP